MSDGDYDVIVLGGGFSGMAAATRLAAFGLRVLLCESNPVRLGGLNTWYERGGRVLDTGLHAVTNYVPPTEAAAPLNRVLRQLRIRRDDLRLMPQRQSRILFPSCELRLTNDFAEFTAQVERLFPADAEGFRGLVEEIRRYGYSTVPLPCQSSEAVLKRHISSGLLRSMLRMPVMYYGNPRLGDMEFSAFATMFRSVVMEGFARPAGGMKEFLSVVARRLEASGATVRLGCTVSRILVGENGRANGVETTRGETLRARRLVSTIGAFETGRLCGASAPTRLATIPPGEAGFFEAILELPKKPAEYGLEDAILFCCDSGDFKYEPPENPLMVESMLVCAPGNYPGCGEAEARLLRLSTITSPKDWFNTGTEKYQRAKAMLVDAMKGFLDRIAPKIRQDARLVDCFTPKTVQRWTGHENGAIYGAPVKLPDFDSGMPGLSVAGTDQGLLGIVGSMLSGILAANTLLAEEMRENDTGAL